MDHARLGGVDPPYARTFGRTESEEFSELRGDDVPVASRGAGPRIEGWELENGGLPLEPYKLVAGGATVDTSTTPNGAKTYTKLATDAQPYFKVEGRRSRTPEATVRDRLPGQAHRRHRGRVRSGEFHVTGATGGAGSRPQRRPREQAVLLRRQRVRHVHRARGGTVAVPTTRGSSRRCRRGEPAYAAVGATDTIPVGTTGSTSDRQERRRLAELAVIDGPDLRQVQKERPRWATPTSPHSVPATTESAASCSRPNGSGT